MRSGRVEEATPAYRNVPDAGRLGYIEGMNAPGLSLFFAPGSSSMAVHIALHEIGVPFESRPLSMAAGATRTPAFLAINAEGKVPVLSIDGRPLTEVSAILFYLAARFPEAALLPLDMEAQAQVLSWMSFVASTLHPVLSKGIEQAGPVFARAEQRLGTRDWAVERYSIADIHLFRLFWRFWNTYPVQESEYPKLCAHYDRMMARPAVQHTCEIEAALGYELRGLTLRGR
jgi:glutathione S-transferase